MRVLLCCCLTLLLAGCEGMFGTIPGQHWRLAVASSDPKLEVDTARQLGVEAASHLALVVRGVVTEGKSSPVSFVDLADSADTIGMGVTIFVDRRDSAITISTRYFGRSPDAEKLERAMAERVIALVKQSFPGASAAPFIAYRGLLGP